MCKKSGCKSGCGQTLYQSAVQPGVGLVKRLVAAAKFSEYSAGSRANCLGSRNGKDCCG